MSKNKTKKKKLGSNISIIYISTSLIFVALFVVFISSKLYMEENIPIKFNELNVVYDLKSKGKLTINEWKYDEDKNIMEVVLLTDGIKNYDNDLSFSAISRVDRKKLLDINIPYAEDDIYVVHINNVPKNFEQIALKVGRNSNEYSDLFIEGETEEKETDTVSVLYTDQRVVKIGKVEEKNAKKYAIEVAITMTGKLQDDIISIAESNKNIDKAIELLNVQIEEKEDDKIYQTAEEQLDTNAEIHSLMYKITELEAEKLSNSELVLVNEKKIEKMNQKKNDLEMGS